MIKLLLPVVRAQTNTQGPNAEVGFKKAVGANFIDIVLGIPWWLFIALGLILLYISWILEERKTEEKQES